jgi:hypothetical protein
MRRLLIVAVALLALAIGVPAKASPINLVVNGDFATGDFTGWTELVPSPPGFVYTFVQNEQARLGPVGYHGYLVQDIATTIGQKYTFSFDLAIEEGGGNDFFAYANVFGGPALLSLVDVGPSGFTHYVFSIIATDIDTVIGFKFRNDPGWWVLDNVSLTATPIPPALLLFISALLPMAWVGYRRRTTAAG